MKPSSAAILLLAFVAATGAAAQSDNTEAELRRMIADSEREASSRWGVSPILRILPQGNHLRSRPDGRIEISLDAARRLIEGAPPDRARDVLAWVLAHEVWHQVQYRDGFSNIGATVPQRRRAECAADVMAGLAVFDADLAKRGANPTEEDLLDIAAKLGSVVEVASSLESQSGGFADHPEASKRRTAVRHGFARALKERATSLADNAETRLLRDHLAKIYDIRSWETAGEWADRSCGLILHDGDGVADLIKRQPAIDWNATGNPPIVRFRIPYRSKAAEPIEAILDVRTVMVPRISPEDRDSWKDVDSKRYRVIIQPGGEYVLAGSLGWVATDEARPRLLIPGDAESLFNARRLDPASTTAAAPDQTMVHEQSPSLMKLKVQLDEIFRSARRRFELVSHRCELGETRTCELIENPVGTSSSKVIVEADGSARLYIDIYRGDSLAGSRQAFDRYYSWLRAIYPTLRFEERHENAIDELLIKPSPLADLYLTRRKRAGGDQIVEMTVVPRFF